MSPTSQTHQSQVLVELSTRESTLLPAAHPDDYNHGDGHNPTILDTPIPLREQTDCHAGGHNRWFLDVLHPPK